MVIQTKHIPNHILYVNGVTKSFDGFKALNNLSFTVKPGELRAIIGPNGAGKTTMMDVITGKLKPDVGDVLIWESWLRHEVPMNMAEDERISVSFNYKWE